MPFTTWVHRLRIVEMPAQRPTLLAHVVAEAVELLILYATCHLDIFL